MPLIPQQIFSHGAHRVGCDVMFVQSPAALAQYLAQQPWASVTQVLTPDTEPILADTSSVRISGIYSTEDYLVPFGYTFDSLQEAIYTALLAWTP